MPNRVSAATKDGYFFCSDWLLNQFSILCNVRLLLQIHLLFHQVALILISHFSFRSTRVRLGFFPVTNDENLSQLYAVIVFRRHSSRSRVSPFFAVSLRAPAKCPTHFRFFHLLTLVSRLPPSHRVLPS